MSRCFPSPFLRIRKEVYCISFLNFLVLNCLKGMVFIAHYFRLVVLNTDNTSQIFAWAPLSFNCSDVGPGIAIF